MTAPTASSTSTPDPATHIGISFFTAVRTGLPIRRVFLDPNAVLQQMQISGTSLGWRYLGEAGWNLIQTGEQFGLSREDYLANDWTCMEQSDIKRAEVDPASVWSDSRLYDAPPIPFVEAVRTRMPIRRRSSPTSGFKNRWIVLADRSLGERIVPCWRDLEDGRVQVLRLYDYLAIDWEIMKPRV